MRISPMLALLQGNSNDGEEDAEGGFNPFTAFKVSPTVGSDLWRFLPSRTTIGNLEVGNVYKSLIVPVVESLVRRTENDSAIGFGKIREGGGGRGFNFCVRLYANRGVDDVDSMGEE
ncbi:hypothetical protein ScalyP_jg8507, partial [Parmales sp. scaly parma]